MQRTWSHARETCFISIDYLELTLNTSMIHKKKVAFYEHNYRHITYLSDAASYRFG